MHRLNRGLFITALIAILIASGSGRAWAQSGGPSEPAPISTPGLPPLPTPQGTAQPQSQQPPTPVPQAPQQAPGSQPPPPAQPSQGGNPIQQFLRTVETLRNFFANPDKQASTTVDWVAQIFGGGPNGLEGWIQKWQDSVLFIPRFYEDSILEKYAMMIKNIAIGLWMISWPLYFILKAFRVRKDSMASFVIVWLLLSVLLFGNRQIWETMAIIFKMLVVNTAGPELVPDLKTLIDAIFNSWRNNPNLFWPMVASLVFTFITLWVMALKYLAIAYHLMVEYIFNAIPLVGMVYGNFRGAIEVFGKALVRFTELAVTWIAMQVSISFLASPPIRDWAWFVISPVALVLLFTPEIFTWALVKAFTLARPRDEFGQSSSSETTREKDENNRETAQWAVLGGVLALNLVQDLAMVKVRSYQDKQQDRRDDSQEQQIEELREKVVAIQRGEPAMQDDPNIPGSSTAPQVSLTQPTLVAGRGTQNMTQINTPSTVVNPLQSTTVTPSSASSSRTGGEKKPTGPTLTDSVLTSMMRTALGTRFEQQGGRTRVRRVQVRPEQVSQGVAVARGVASTLNLSLSSVLPGLGVAALLGTGAFVMGKTVYGEWHRADDIVAMAMAGITPMIRQAQEEQARATRVSAARYREVLS